MKPRPTKYNLTLGEYYHIRTSFWQISKKKFKLIRTSPKGFNFLDEKNNKCILKRAMFAYKYGGQPIGKEQTFPFLIYGDLKITKVK